MSHNLTQMAPRNNKRYLIFSEKVGFKRLETHILNIDKRFMKHLCERYKTFVSKPPLTFEHDVILKIATL